MQIKAITFDLWDTLIIDNSDEQVRAQRGLRTKYDERVFLIWQAVESSIQPPIEEVRKIYDAVNQEFNAAWHDQSITWTVAQRCQKIFDALGVSPTLEALSRLHKELEAMEVNVPPQAVAGVGEALAILRPKYNLGIISDAIFTPGTALRELLKSHDILKYFTSFSFSDQIGRSKPHPKIFKSAIEQLAVDSAHIVHIGDREHNDIQGAHRAGMKAILFTGSRDADVEGTTADAVFNDYRELPDILKRLPH